MIPRTLGLATVQLNLIAMTLFASLLATGSIAVFNFANNLQYFPIGIVGISFAVAAFPTFAQLIAQGQTEKFIRHLSTTIRQILFFILPLTIIFLLLRAQIVRVVLGSGQFDWNATILTSDTLALFSVSLFAQALIPLFARAFYALQDTWTPFVAGIVGSIINIILAWYLKDIFGVTGLAISFSAGAIIQLAVLWLLLRLKIRTIHELSILLGLFKISIALIIMALLTQWIKTPLASFVDMTRFWGILTQGAIAGSVGLLVYGTICYLLKVEEMMVIAKSMRRKWLKLAYIQGEINDADEL